MLHLLENLCHITHDTLKLFVLSVFFLISCDDFFLDSFGCRFTGFLFLDLHSCLQLAVVVLDDFCLEVSVHLQEFNFCLFLADSLYNLILEGNQVTHRLMPFKERF